MARISRAPQPGQEPEQPTGKAGKGKGKHRGHNEGSIYQRKSDGRWVAAITIETEKGKKRKPLYGKTRKEVAEKLRVAQHAQQQGTLITEKDQKLTVYLDYWLEKVQQPRVRVSSYVQRRSIVRNHLQPALGHIGLQKLTTAHLQNLYAQKSHEGLAPGYIGQIHAVLRSALEHAVRSNLLARNVARSVSPPRIEPHQAQALTPAQAVQLLEAAQGNRLEVFILLAVRWDDLDLEQGQLHIQRSVSRIAGYGYVENEPKTKSSRRQIVLPAVVAEALQQHRAQQKQARIQAGDNWQEHGLVFCNRHGGFMHVSNLLRTFHQLVEAAGLPPMRFHDLRHSAATILLMKGVQPKVVQELLGHSSIAITMNVYSHVMPSMQKEAMDMMGDIFKQP